MSTHAPVPTHDWRSLPLHAGGRSLIEASAGTGKTWTIAALSLRLLLEHGWLPSQMIVATFTNAAAEELRRRLRARLEDALRRADAASAEVDDAVQQWLHARWQADAAARGRDTRRLQAALAEFDIAPIGTLHGLCQRILAEHPLACGGALLPAELVDADDAIDEIALDLWRRLQHGDAGDPLLALHADVTRPATLERLRTRLRRLLRPGLQLDPAATDPDSVFWRALAATGAQTLSARLEARDQRSFDSLLTRVADTLDAERGAASRPLADALFRQWPVALVDEFQDTDAVQFGILDAIYRDADGPRGRLVMIGDPKQAIYRFRGGDIRAYLQAAGDVAADDRITLDVNHRACTALVHGVNRFFAATGARLCADDDDNHDDGDAAPAPIHCTPVRSRAEAEGRCDDDAAAPALVIHVDAELGDRHTRAADRVQAALQACTGQIVALLAAGRAVPSDIAVLLHRHADIDTLRGLLRARGVPCVSAGRRRVFDGDAARELHAVLHAVWHAGDAAALRAAATTRLWGLDLAALRQDDDAPVWRAAAARVLDGRQSWQRRGVLAVVEDLVAQVAPGVLRSVAGERWLTDLRHLGELLQEREAAGLRGAALLAWLARQRTQADEVLDGDALQQRIESDGARVQLMTLHASKGLEFETVILPTLWAHGARTREDDLHECHIDGQRVLAFGDAAARRDRREQQDERFRLLYVAMTRARRDCHVYALSPERRADGRTRKPAQGTARSALDVLLARMQPPLADAAARHAMPEIAWREQWPPPTSARYRPARSAAAVPAQVRVPPPRPPGPLDARHSFSSLLLLAPRLQEEAPAADEYDDSAPAADDRSDSADPRLLALRDVRGTAFGNALHAALEADIAALPQAEQPAVLQAALDAAGVRSPALDNATIAARLTPRLRQALAAPLGLAAAPAVALADIDRSEQRAEMAFHYPVDDVSLRALRAACHAHGEPTLVPAGDARLRGLMTGKIDLVFRCGERFHVLDYKGNHLGDAVDDYLGAALTRAMDHHHYRLQALLYTVALERYLRQRLAGAYRRERHLGEAVYLFVRAAGLAPDAGIWRQAFAPGLLDAVDAVLGAAGDGAAS